MAQIQNVVTVTLNPAIDRIIEVPNLTIGDHQRGQLIMRYPAGKAINVSRCLAVLGRPSVATGFVGREDLSMYEEFLDEKCAGKVVCQFLSVRGRTRENITLVDPVSEVETHIRDAGFKIQRADRDRMLSKLKLLARPETVVCFSGSIPRGLEPEDFVRMVRTCTDNGARVAVDTNGPPLQAMRGESVWLLKPNLKELEELVGQPVQGEEQMLDAALKLTEHVKVVILTRGAEGACVVTRRARYIGRVAVHPGLIQNTVGCGDSLLAGFLDAWMEGKSLDASLRHALAVATANATELGTATFDTESVAAYEAMAEVSPWKPS